VSGSHRHAAPARPRTAEQARLVRVLACLLVPLALLTVVAMLLLHPDGPRPQLPSGVGPQAALYDARVVDAPPPCPAGGQDEACTTATVRLSEGPDAGATAAVTVTEQALPGHGRVVLAYDPQAGPQERYAFADTDRDRPFLLLAALFAAAVVALGRWSGLRALIGLGVSGSVLVLFVLPAVLAGQSALPVALTGAAAIMFGVLYLTHGVSVQTSIAVLGTLASLTLTVALGQAFVVASGLTGFGSDEASLLDANVAGLDLQGLLLAGIVIGALGVLDDVTITQGAAVWEIHQADPTASFVSLYRAGIRIGREHIASTVNTLVLAYAGASLPLLAVFTLAGTGPLDALTSEVVGQEVVRALVGSIGLVAAVPVTTALAAAAVRTTSR
jgi:uncharacterized membrane protein